MLPITSTRSTEPRRRRRREQQQGGASEKARLFGAVIFGLCALSVIDSFRTLEPYSSSSGRRSLLSNAYLAAQSTLLPWAHHYLVDVTDKPNPDGETALFWHM